MREELLSFLKKQIEVKQEWLLHVQPSKIVALLKTMNFPLLLKTDVPL